MHKVAKNIQGIYTKSRFENCRNDYNVTFSIATPLGGYSVPYSSNHYIVTNKWGTKNCRIWNCGIYAMGAQVSSIHNIY